MTFTLVAAKKLEVIKLSRKEDVSWEGVFLQKKEKKGENFFIETL